MVYARRCPNNWMTAGQPLSVKRSSALALRFGTVSVPSATRGYCGIGRDQWMRGREWVVE